MPKCNRATVGREQDPDIAMSAFKMRQPGTSMGSTGWSCECCGEMEPVPTILTGCWRSWEVKATDLLSMNVLHQLWAASLN